MNTPQVPLTSTPKLPPEPKLPPMPDVLPFDDEAGRRALIAWAEAHAVEVKRWTAMKYVLQVRHDRNTAPPDEVLRPRGRLR